MEGGPIRLSMATVVQDSSTTRRRTVVTAVAAVVVVLLVVGFAFVNSTTMARVARDARSLHWTDTVAGSAALALVRADHAVTISEIRAGDTFALLAARVDQLEATYGELVSLAAKGEDHPAFPALARFVAPVEAIVADLNAGNITEARSQLDTSLRAAHSELTSALTDARASLQASVDSGTGTAAGWIEFALVLAIPLCLTGVLYIVFRRWMAAVESRSVREIAVERESIRAREAVVADLSRELRTPLTSVYGFAQILSRGEVAGVEAMRETAKLIADEAAEMTRIVDDIMVASTLDSTGVEVDDKATRIGVVIEDAIAPFEQCGVAVDREPTVAMARTDAALLGHVLTNLLANAVRHGGPEIGLGVTVGDDTVDIEVADNGPGLPEQEAKTILGRMSGDAPLLDHGSGLGLAVASRLTRAMGGSLRYQRYSGRTYFVVTLPADAGRDEVGDEISVAEMIKTLSA